MEFLQDKLLAFLFLVASTYISNERKTNLGNFHDHYNEMHEEFVRMATSTIGEEENLV